MKRKKWLLYSFAAICMIVFVWQGIPALIHSVIPSKKTVVTHQALVQQIQEMGHMQVVKLNIKDIVEYKVERTLLPDSKVLLMVAGEIGASVDLQKLSEKDIIRSESRTLIYIPTPEITYSKIDHQNTKIHDKTSWILLDDDAELIDNCYKQADLYMQSDEVKAQAIQAAIDAAPGILAPIFSKLTGTPVEIKFHTRSILG